MQYVQLGSHSQIEQNKTTLPKDGISEKKRTQSMLDSCMSVWHLTSVHLPKAFASHL
jgi:hypothetical protein